MDKAVGAEERRLCGSTASSAGLPSPLKPRGPAGQAQGGVALLSGTEVHIFRPRLTHCLPVHLQPATMASYTPSPGNFKAKDADPEATLERFNDYVEKMEMVFMLARRINPTTNAKVEFDDAEKKAMLKVEGGDDMMDLFRKSKAVDGDTYAEAVARIKDSLTAKGNRTSAVFKLFNSNKQGSQSFDSWHQRVIKAAKLIDWTDYDWEKAAVDAMILQTSSTKLQQRAIQENVTCDELIALGTSQEQSRKKAASMPGGEGETVNRLQLENESRGGNSPRLNPQKARARQNAARAALTSVLIREESGALQQGRSACSAGETRILLDLRCALKRRRKSSQQPGLSKQWKVVRIQRNPWDI